jgi:CRP-like cAMP-binding protein
LRLPVRERSSSTLSLSHRPSRNRTNARRLLASLPAKDFALLAPQLKDIVLEQGAVLQEQGERIDQVYFPHAGIVSLLAVMRQGDAIETATIGYEGAVGSFVGLGSRRAHTRAVVQVSGSASRIGASRFRKVAQESEAVCRLIVRLWRDVADRSSANRRLQRAASGRGPADPLAAASPRPARKQQHQAHPQFLSQMLGVRRTTVTVVANMLQQAGLIRYHRGHIEIVDQRGLEAGPANATMPFGGTSKKSRRRPAGRRRQRWPLKCDFSLRRIGSATLVRYPTSARRREPPR